MNYTTNYHLPQWVESDRILMEDFNDAMENIDGGIKGAKDAASVAQTAAESAQSTANTAESKADAAQTTASAAYCPDNKPYVFGTYEGTGRNITVTLGFQPSAVLIYECYNGSSAEDAAGGCTFHYDSSMSRKIILEDDGFNVRTNYGDYPYTNRSGYTYVYMAFR